MKYILEMLKAKVAMYQPQFSTLQITILKSQKYH